MPTQTDFALPDTSRATNPEDRTLPKCPREPDSWEVSVVRGILRLLVQQNAITSIPSDGVMLNDWAYLLRHLLSVTGWSPAVLDARLGRREGFTAKVIAPRGMGNVGGSVEHKSPMDVLRDARKRSDNAWTSRVIRVVDGRSVRIKGRSLSNEFVAAWLRHLADALLAGEPVAALSEAITSISVRRR